MKSLSVTIECSITLKQKFKSRDNLFMLKALCEMFHFSNRNHGSLALIFFFQFVDEPFVCNLGVLFKTLELSEGDIKELCDCLIGDSVGRRTALIEKMEKWVNYQDE